MRSNPHTLIVGIATLVLMLVAGCTESYRPDVSTETGNPPFIDSSKIALVVKRDEVHVVGEPGAVAPPEGTIEVTILRNQDVARGPVESDGSFDVELDATLDDVFEVRAVNGGRRSMAVIVLRGGAQVGEGDGGVLSCEQKSDYAYDAVTQAITNADRRCETATDCVLASPDSACFAGCGFDYVSVDGSASIQAVVEALDQVFCEDFEDGCDRIVPPCVPPREAECVAGQCEPNANGGMVAVDGGTGSACTECLSVELSWRVTGSGSLPALPSTDTYTLSGCNTLTVGTEAGETCSKDVLRCDDRSDAASIERIIATLSSEDVITAMEEGGAYGPADFGLAGHFIEITIDGRSFMYRTCWAEGECEWPGLDALALMLIELGSTEGCVPNAVEHDCTSNFENGDCDAIFQVWWHNPASGACQEMQYGGCGGNGNRYESAAACTAACAAPLECPPNRINVQDCFMCGLSGGCAEVGDFCALVCSSDADCADEPGAMGWGTQCDIATGVCETAGACI